MGNQWERSEAELRYYLINESLLLSQKDRNLTTTGTHKDRLSNLIDMEEEGRFTNQLDK